LAIGAELNWLASGLAVTSDRHGVDPIEKLLTNSSHAPELVGR